MVDDPAVNAFALPGGFIYVTLGLLAYLGNEAQLASVLGHVRARALLAESASGEAALQLTVGPDRPPEQPAAT